MRMSAAVFGMVALGVAMGCGEEKKEQIPPLARAEAVVQATGATPITGRALFTEVNGEVRLDLTISGLPRDTTNHPTLPERHGFHIHETGDCGPGGNPVAPGGAAGGHWNPDAHSHGTFGTGHLGDIGNMDIDGEGKGTLTFSTTLWTIGSNNVNDIVGKAVIFHQKTDDQASQPAGAAGARLGCGIINRID